jgi:hypothetical protein
MCSLRVAAGCHVSVNRMQCNHYVTGNVYAPSSQDKYLTNEPFSRNTHIQWCYLVKFHIRTMPVTKKKSSRPFIAASSQPWPLTKRKHIPTSLHAPHRSLLADLFFRHAAQCAQGAFVGMVCQEAMIVRCQTANDVSATGSAVSGVFDGVGLVFVSGSFNIACIQNKLGDVPR